jgi:YtkA-like
MKTPWLAALLGLLLAAQAQPVARAKVDLRCDAVAIGPMLDCVVQLAARDGKPLDGAQVTLGATMPSMPMAHRVKPAAAAPTGRPGEYRGTLELEMSGVWALQIDIAGALRDRAIVRLQAEECADGQKRCAQRPVGSR